MDTKRYDVGPEQGYRTRTTIKLTDEQARAMGLTSKNVSDVTTTADDVTKRDSYEEAITRQNEMRETEAAAAAVAEPDAAPGAPAGKARPAPKK